MFRRGLAEFLSQGLSIRSRVKNDGCVIRLFESQCIDNANFVLDAVLFKYQLIYRIPIVVIFNDNLMTTLL